MRPSDEELAAQHEAYLAVVEPVRAGLLGLIDLVIALEETHVHRPVAMSPALAEEREEPAFGEHITGRPVLVPRNFAALQVRAAADLFGAMCRLYELPATVLFADRVLLRAGIEAAARSLWLHDWRLDVRRRVARGLTERLHDLHQNQQLAGDDGAEERRRTRAQILRDAAAAGYVTLEPKRDAAWVGEPRPSATAVMVDLFGTEDAEPALGRTAQRYLSMFVHATTSGLISVASREDVVDHGDGELSTALVSNANDANNLLAFASLAWITAASSWVTFMGWPTTGWVRAVRNQQGLIATRLR